jgi:hypothetical protein
MSRKNRCLSSEGTCRAPARKRPSKCRIVGCILLLAASFAALFPAAHATADDHTIPATNGIYLSPLGTGHAQGVLFPEYNVNLLLGAQRFYNAGFDGAGAVMANIEAGYIWSGHETLGHVQQIPTSPSALGELDRHGTWVAMVMGGRPTVNDASHDYQRGMAPGAQLFSGAIATGWSPSPVGTPRYSGSFFLSFSSLSTLGPYRAAFITGLTGPNGTRTADVINSSYAFDLGSSTLTGTDNLTGTFDALINENPRTLLTWAAGNTQPPGSGAGPNKVVSAASGYNNMSVAALDPSGGALDVPSQFSNGGPNDYSDPFHFAAATRQVIDIAAPGRNFSTAYYGGETGGNSPVLGGAANGPAGGPDFYTQNVSGTSFAAPTVAGGAALLYDAAHTLLAATPDARDARVMKAVLMNSADKTPGWNNGQVAQPNGGVVTTQGLDNRVGAGRMNLDTAFDQFLSGTADVTGTGQGSLGMVQRTGWDFGLVAQGTDNDYLIGATLLAGTKFNATLDWFRDRQTIGATSFRELSEDNLDLQLWEAVGGIATNLIAESKSTYNNSEHFSFNLPKTAQYLLRVHWTSELFDMVSDANSEHYGLAWAAVPEPGTIMLAICAVFVAVACTSRRRWQQHCS